MEFDRGYTLHQEQVALFQTDHLLVQPARHFSIKENLAKLHNSQQIVALDIGGDKIRRATYTVENGKLEKKDESIKQSVKGNGYLTYLERVADDVNGRDIPVGISSAGTIAGTTLKRTTNLPEFLEEFSEKYHADYAALFPDNLFVANDTITGNCGASVALAQQGYSTESTIFVISASGVGASVLKDNHVFQTEIGHVPVIEELNPLSQRRVCGVNNNQYVCVERVASARSGIEDIYEQHRNIRKSGDELGVLYEEGNDILVNELYDISLQLVAHGVIGLIDRFLSDTEDVSVVLHGGNYNIQKYRNRTIEALGAFGVIRPHIVFSRDISQNICLDGAAIAAAY